MRNKNFGATAGLSIGWSNPSDVRRLLRKVTRQKAHTPEAVVAKLVVASRRMGPEHEPEAYRIVRDTIKDLRRLHQLKA